MKMRLVAVMDIRRIPNRNTHTSDLYEPGRCINQLSPRFRPVLPVFPKYIGITASLSGKKYPPYISQRRYLFYTSLFYTFLFYTALFHQKFKNMTQIYFPSYSRLARFPAPCFPVPVPGTDCKKNTLFLSLLSCHTCCRSRIEDTADSK